MRYALQRLVQFILVFVVVTFTVLAFTRIGSTDPARDLAGGAVSEAQIAQVEEDYPYLDKPLVVQYGYWLKDILTGEVGPVLRRQPVGRRHVQATHAEPRCSSPCGRSASAC